MGNKKEIEMGLACVRKLETLKGWDKCERKKERHMRLLPQEYIRTFAGRISRKTQ